MKTSQFGIPTVRILVTGIFALLFVAGASLSLSHFEAQAQPTAPSDADLTVTKKVSKAQARSGETLAYTITVENSGDESAVLITDALSSELIYTPDTLDANFSDTLMISADDVISWEGTIGVDQTAEVWFNAQIFTNTTASEIQNTAYITDTVSVITDSCQTAVISDQIHSQIRSPNKNAYITQKGSTTIEGIAWQEGSSPPYLTDDTEFLPVEWIDKENYRVKWTSVVSATEYQLEEATQPGFPKSDITYSEWIYETQKTFTKSDENNTYYYRVRAIGSENPSRWSNVISVTVPLEETTTNPQVSPLAATNASAGEPITVQIRISETAHVKDLDWTTAAVITPEDEWGGEWSYEWDLPEARETPYAIQTRACGESIACGGIDTITVTLDNKDFKIWLPRIFKRWPPIPYPPTLYDIDNADQDSNYVVEWTYDHDTSQVPEPTSYTLQESKDAGFPDNQTTEYTVDDGTSKEITSQESGTYYYRARGHNSYGPGEWSEIKQVTVWGYFDDFSDHASGWPREWSKTRGAMYQVKPYEHPDCGPDKDCKYEDGDGYVIARRKSPSEPYARFGPGVEIPSSNYEIEFKSRWFEAQYHATYQIFFDSNKNFDSFYSIKIMIYDPGNDNTCGYQVYGSNGSVNAFGEEIINELSSFTREDAINCGVRNHNGGSTGDTGWNHWRIRRESNKIKIYVNGKHLGTWTASAKSHRYFGVGSTLYEGLTPSKPEFDDWSVKLLQ
jgi:uncharacterized repeat protein (TIGR01451 family)